MPLHFSGAILRVSAVLEVRQMRSGFEVRGGIMKRSELTLPEVGLIAGTRGMLGAGVALLLADRLSEDQRKVIGWTLFLMGVVSTIPLVMDVLSKRH
jgi:hypothetical protein